MSPVIFAYVCLFTLLLAGAAAAFEWGTRGRIAARHVWTFAIVASIIAPAALLIWNAGETRSNTATRSAAVDAAPIAIILNAGKAGIVDAGHLAKRDAIMRTIVPNRRTAGETVAQVSRRLAAVALPIWGLLSVSVLVWLAFGVARWRRASRSWQRTNVDGIDVDISATTGPAVLGFVSQRIVLPAWISDMSLEHRQLILAHESEHIRARDPQRLAVAIAAIALMPWNLGLWLCAAKLRRAVELDCDARVLQRFPGARDYGYVLLEVASRARRVGRLAVPMIALLGLPSELETRLRAMTRPRSASSRMIVGGALVAAVSIATAFSTPVPRLHAEQGLAALRSVARLASFHGAHSVATDTVPSRAGVSATEQRRSVDSVNALVHTLQEKTVQLERAQSELSASREALLAAASHLPIPDSVRTRIAAGSLQMWGTPFMTKAANAQPALAPEAQRPLQAKLAQIREQAESAVRSRYPRLIADPSRAAVIWFLADSSGRVIDARYHDGYPRPFTSIDKLSAQFPRVNDAAVDIIAERSRVAGRDNVLVVWVRMKGDPSQYFKPFKG